MPPIQDTTIAKIAYEFAREFKQGFIESIQEAGTTYQDQTGDNGGAIKFAFYILISIAVFFAVDQRLTRRQDRRDRIEAARLQRKHEKEVAEAAAIQRKDEADRLGNERKEGRVELLGAVANVNKNAIEANARIEREIERLRDEFRGAIGNIDSRTSKLEGKLEK